MSTDILPSDSAQKLSFTDTDRVNELINEHTDTLDLPSTVGESVDLCSLECLQAVDLESRKESLLADLDSKDRLLDDPDPKPVVSEEFSTIE